MRMYELWNCIILVILTREVLWFGLLVDQDLERHNNIHTNSFPIIKHKGEKNWILKTIIP